MRLLRSLTEYKIGAIGGLLYGVVGFITLYGLGLCETSDGVCIVFSPLIFHQGLVELAAASLATPLFLIPLNIFIFIFEGAAIQWITHKLK
jgi:hypothetical protein